MSKNLPKQSVIVFDEAHNIDNVCIDSMSLSLNKRLLQRCGENLESINTQIKRLKEHDEERLTNEYTRLGKVFFFFRTQCTVELIFENVLSLKKDLLTIERFFFIL